MTNIFQTFYEATNFAAKIHGGQMYGNLPYMKHIRDVMFNALRFELDFDQIIACILHDTLEDGDTNYHEILDLFGQDVADLVELVTDEPGETRKERKEATYKKLRGNPDAIAVKLCDRIANLESSIFGVSNLKMLKMYLDEDPLFSSLDDGETNRELWNKYRSLISIEMN